MSEAYGAIVFTKSEECKFDANQLVNALNAFDWDLSDGYWIADSEVGEIYLSEESLYPNAMPYTLNEHGFTGVNDWEDEEDRLGVISKLISPILQNGSIEITSVASDGTRSVHFSKLYVSSDGHVGFWAQNSETKFGTDTTDDWYCPNSSHACQ